MLRGASSDGGKTSYTAIYVSGFDKQYMWIVPDLDLVVLVFHHNPRDGEHRHSLRVGNIEEYVIPAVIHD